MISLANTGAVIPCDNYYIRHVYDGLDELIFSISIYDPLYKDIVEESVLVERGEQYIVKAIDAGTNAANIKAQIDTTALKADMLLNYTNSSATPLVTISGVLPSGWTCVDLTGIATRRTITFDAGVTPFDVIRRVCEVWDITVQYSPASQKVTLINPASIEPLGAFATRDLNLKSIQYKGKSTEIITRLYAYGKEGLSFASINDGKPYVENLQYTNRIIAGYWEDERYTLPETLLADATSKLNELAKPDSSYECAIVDLAATNPELYSFEDFTIHKKVLLIDDLRDTSVVHVVAEHTEYPYYPEKNEVTLSKVMPRISKTVMEMATVFADPTSDFYQQIQGAVAEITNAILNGTGGNIVFNTNAAGRIYEMVVLDTDSIATAKDVWRLNLGGYAHSSNGYNGPYEYGITQDGRINASLITTGSLDAATVNVINLNASNITAGYLRSSNYSYTSGTFADAGFNLDLASGQIRTKQFTLTSTGNAYFAGNLSAASGTFAGNLSAVGGTFKGSLSAVDGTFTNLTGTGSIKLGNANILPEAIQLIRSDINKRLDLFLPQSGRAYVTSNCDINLGGYDAGSYYQCSLFGSTIYFTCTDTGYNMKISVPGTNEASLIPNTAGTCNIGTNAYYFDYVHANTVTQHSLRKDKTDISDLSDEDYDIDKMRPIVYRIKPKKDKPKGELQIGLIAEELEQCCYKACSHDENGELYGIDYSRLAVVAIKELQTLRKRVKELEERSA